MSEDKKNNSRRKVLKVAAGAGLVAGSKAGWESNKWTKPVVESVLLPAHAQTSPFDPNGRYSGSTSVTAVVMNEETSPFDSLIKSAYANNVGIEADLCISIENEQADVAAAINGFSPWEGTGDLDTVISLMPDGKTKSTCVVENVKLDVNVKGTAPNREAYGNLTFNYGYYTDKRPLPEYSGPYVTMESDETCKLELTMDPLVKCVPAKK